MSQESELAFRSCQFSYAVTGVSGEKSVFLSLHCSFMPSLTKGLLGVKLALFPVWGFVKLWRVDQLELCWFRS